MILSVCKAPGGVKLQLRSTSELDSVANIEQTLDEILDCLTREFSKADAATGYGSSTTECPRASQGIVINKT